ncbi:MAG: protein kinase [Thermoanaerobaculales bacterium]|nr:protein kinase [Thermoanaerobaculales bacterium]
MSGLVGQTLGRYEIVGGIGAGGMGEVYRAWDAQLGRMVAVKVITEDSAGERRSIDRFEREARTVAQLSHPNILAIHDFGEDRGIMYAVTELLEGRDLAARLRSGPLPLAKALSIAVEVANGLAAAHGKGIIHRDIKPENVFITTTGQVKILDFGIAGLRDASFDDPPDVARPTKTLTGAGKVVGTPGYLSPEQARGETADARSDIFSFGALLYEMLTGQRAFQGATPNETMLAILNRDPPPMSQLRPSIPEALEIVVRRCLEKQPDERFESARDVAFALQAISTTGRTSPVDAMSQRRRARNRRLGAAAIGVAAIVAAAAATVQLTRRPPPPMPEKKHLQVMRFAAIGEDPELQQMADGLTESTTTGLARIEHSAPGKLWVVPRAMARKPDASTVEAAHRKLNITLAIQGRLARSGGRTTLTLEAVDPTTGAVLRSTEIAEDPGNLVSFQREPARRIAGMIGLGDSPALADAATTTMTNIASALTVYLRGLGVLRQSDDAAGIESAIDLLETAATDDPLFTPARVALAEAHLRHYQASRDDESLRRALEVAASVPDGDGERAAALFVTGSAHRAARSLVEAADALERSLAVQPNDAEARLELGHTYQAMGRPDDAREQYYRAIYLRPGYWPGNHWLAVLYYTQADYAAAATEFRRVVESAPMSPFGYDNLAVAYDKLGLKDEALQALERSIQLNPGGSSVAYLNLGKLYFDDSRFGDAAAMFERSIAIDPDDGLAWSNLAYSYASGADPSKTEETARTAIGLSEKELVDSPDEPELLCRLAGLHALVGERERGVELLERAVATDSQNPIVIGNIAGTWEDLGERDRALEWVERAFARGVLPSRFESRPLLRGLVADDRYRALVDGASVEHR